jgi:hypothetical protein
MTRSRGALTGFLLMLLGAWGAIVPFVGHYFGYGFTPNNTWTWTAPRGWLEVLPGAVTFAGGLVIAGSRQRVMATLAGWLAAGAGAWFVLGTVVSPLWSAGFLGIPDGTTTDAVLERIGMFSGLGLVIVFLAAVALGRVSLVGARDVIHLDAPPMTAGATRVQEPAYPTSDRPAAAPVSDGANAPRATSGATEVESTRPI